jgi:hypothetical protein
MPVSTALDGARAYLACASDAGLTRRDQAELCKLWNAAPEEVAYFDFLNEASTSAFLSHTAKLEGFTDAN